MNPYPKTIVDETSGVEVPNEKYRIWQEGYEAGLEETPENALERATRSAALLKGKVSVRVYNAILKAYWRKSLKEPLNELSDNMLLGQREIWHKSLAEIRTVIPRPK